MVERQGKSKQVVPYTVLLVVHVFSYLPLLLLLLLLCPVIPRDVVSRQRTPSISRPSNYSCVRRHIHTRTDGRTDIVQGEIRIVRSRARRSSFLSPTTKRRARCFSRSKSRGCFSLAATLNSTARCRCAQYVGWLGLALADNRVIA